jgi:hypothetical protein
MPSYGHTNALVTLRGLRAAAQSSAKRVLAAALAAHRRAAAEAERLAERLADKRGSLTRARAGGSSTERAGRAADAQGRARYLARLTAELDTAAKELETHRAGTLAAATRELESARATLRKANQEHQAIEKTIARRESTHRRESDRRAEAAQDDVARK